MYSGVMEPRKNADTLIKAFSMLGNELLRETQLVIVGKISAHDQMKFNYLASTLKIADRVVFTGFVTDQELISLYSSTSAYVFPSLHEGFGLPALEAMACGAPTIGSNTTSIPEVIGRQDALFNPREPASIANTISRVLEDSVFSFELRLHAKAQASNFSWDNTARTALCAMEKIYAKRTIRQRVWPVVFEELNKTYEILIKNIGALSSKTNETDLKEAASLIGNGMASNEKAFTSVSLLGVAALLSQTLL